MTPLLQILSRFRYVIYLALIAIAYAGSLGVPFYFDDTHSIADNASLRSIDNLFQHWVNTDLTSSLPENRSYRPLTYMTYNLSMALGAGSTLPFHLHKLLLLFGICVLIEKIWNRISKSKDFFFGFSLACIWAVHPALSEANTYISATSSLQAAFFYFLAFWIFVSKPEKFGAWIIWAALAYSASCFSKEEGITLPAVILVWCYLNGSLKKEWKTIAALSLLGCGLFIFIQNQIPATQATSRGSIPPLHYFFTQLRGYLWYQKIWFWPNDLNADNHQFGFSSSFLDPKVLASFIFQAIITCVLWVKRKTYPLLLFGWVWFYLSISPASSFIPLSEPVNERRMLIAYLGFTGAVHLLLFDRIKKLLPLLLLGLMATTIARVQLWQNPVLLWTDTAEKNHNHVRSLNNLAVAKINSKDYLGALETIKLCKSQTPRYYHCFLNEGISLQALGRMSEAKNAYVTAINMEDGQAAGHYHFARFWLELNEQEKALQEISTALTLSPNFLPAIELKNKIATIRN